MKRFAVVVPMVILGVCLALTSEFARQGNEKGRGVAAQHPSPVAFSQSQSGPPGGNKQSRKGAPRGRMPTQWILIFVTAVTAIFVGWQALETRRSATSMARSVKMQEVGFKQWIEVANWNTYYRVPSGEGSECLDIDLDIVNPTGFSITLANTRVQINAQVFDRAHSIRLVPHVPYTVSVTAALDAGQKDSYLNNALVLQARCSTVYRDVLENWKDQTWTGLLTCSRHGKNFTLCSLPTMLEEG